MEARVNITISVSDRLAALLDRALCLGESHLDPAGSRPVAAVPPPESAEAPTYTENESTARSDEGHDGPVQPQPVWVPADVAARMTGLSEITVKTYGREGRIPRKGTKRKFKYKVESDEPRTLHPQTLRVGDTIVSASGTEAVIVAIEDDQLTYEKPNGKTRTIALSSLPISWRTPNEVAYRPFPPSLLKKRK